MHKPHHHHPTPDPVAPARQSLALATLARLIATARYYTPFGVLQPHDLAGLYRRTASLHGLTADQVQQLHTPAAGGRT